MFSRHRRHQAQLLDALLGWPKWQAQWRSLRLGSCLLGLSTNQLSVQLPAGLPALSLGCGPLSWPARAWWLLMFLVADDCSVVAMFGLSTCRPRSFGVNEFCTVAY